MSDLAATAGGVFDLAVRDSLLRRIRTVLDDLGWLDDPRTDGGTRFHKKVTVPSEPVDSETSLEPNIIGLNLIEVDYDPTGIGELTQVSTQPFGIDIYAESDSIGRRIRGDLLASLLTDTRLPITVRADDDPLAEGEFEGVFGGHSNGYRDHRRHWFTVEGRLEIEPL